jgi:hypothetical protein
MIYIRNVWLKSCPKRLFYEPEGVSGLTQQGVPNTQKTKNSVSTLQSWPNFILASFWVSRVDNWVTQTDLSAFTATWQRTQPWRPAWLLHQRRHTAPGLSRTGGDWSCARCGERRPRFSRSASELVGWQWRPDRIYEAKTMKKYVKDQWIQYDGIWVIWMDSMEVIWMRSLPNCG